MTDANPTSGALTVESAAQQLKNTGLLGGGEKAKPEDDADPASSEEQPKPQEAQPEETPEAHPEHTDEDHQPAEAEEEATGPVAIDLGAEGDRPITLTVDGKPVTTTLAELAKGGMREADYRRKTSEVAEERKAVKAERQQHETERQQHVSTLRTIYQTFEKNLVGAPPDRALLDPSNPKYDPAAYQLQEVQFRDRVGHFRNTLAQLDHADADHNAKRQTALKEQIAQERTKLVEAVPDFADEKKAEGLTKKIRSALTTHYGFTSDELANLGDHRLVRVALDAALYREAKAGVGTKKVEAKPAPYLKPGAPKGPKEAASEKRIAAMAQHGKGGTLQSAVAALKTLTG